MTNENKDKWRNALKSTVYKVSYHSKKNTRIHTEIHYNEDTPDKEFRLLLIQHYNREGKRIKKIQNCGKQYNTSE